MKRRTFIAGLGSAAAWPLVARGQQEALSIGALHAASEDGARHFMEAYRKGLSEEGFVEGRNLRIEYRWADGAFERLPAMMAELVEMRPAAITAFGWAAYAAHSARAAGKAGTIPIILSIGLDPVKSGFISRINRPDNDITGATSLALRSAEKRVKFLHDLVGTRTSKLALLENPTVPDPSLTIERGYVEAATRAVGWQFQTVHATSVAELEPAFAAMAREQVGVMTIATDTFFYGEMPRIAALAARYGFPTAGPLRDFPTAGGLLSYSTSIADTYHQAGSYTGKVLRGVKPEELPFWQPTRFEFVINIKTARALGLNVPSALLAIADEVIE